MYLKRYKVQNSRVLHYMGEKGPVFEVRVVCHLRSFLHLLSCQATGLLQALEVSKAVFMEPKGQGKIGGMLSKFYVSQRTASHLFQSDRSALRSLVLILGGSEICLSQLSLPQAKNVCVCHRKQ